jgi:hypothetical protein
MKGAAVGIHGDDGREPFDFQFPDGFGGAKFFEEIDVADLLHAFREDLGSAADAVEVNAAVFFAGGEGFVAHAAFANDSAQAEVANDLPLVRLFADGSRGSGGGDFPVSLFVFDDDGSAVINDAVAEVYFGRELAAFVQKFVDDIASGENDAADFDRVADFKSADFFFGEGEGDLNHNCAISTTTSGFHHWN